MKALVSLILAVALIGGVYLATTSGCGARAQVAGDNIMKKIDGWLGELDVKKTKIENKIGELTTAVDNVRKKKVEAEVRLEQLEKERGPVTAKIAEVKKALKVLSPHLKSTEDVEINGTMMSPEKINNFATELADEYDMLNQKLGGLDVSVKAYRQAFELLNRQAETGQTTLKTLSGKLQEIATKKEALDAMKTAQTIVGENGSISDEFNKLESEINDLFVDVETGMRLESEKISAREAALESSSNAVDEILGDIEVADQNASRIEAILGGDHQ